MASLERWLEEEALLVEESRRVAVTFEHEANLWKQRSVAWQSDDLGAGKSAYASSQYWVYHKLSVNAVYNHRKIRNNRPVSTKGLIPVPPLGYLEPKKGTEIQSHDGTDALLPM